MNPDIEQSGPGVGRTEIHDIDEPNIGIGHTAIEDTDAEFRVHVDIEDARPEDVLIDIHDDVIEICAQMSEDTELEEAMLHREGMIYRVIPLPADADASRLECSTEDGHLDLIIPKA